MRLALRSLDPDPKSIKKSHLKGPFDGHGNWQPLGGDPSVDRAEVVWSVAPILDAAAKSTTSLAPRR